MRKLEVMVGNPTNHNMNNSIDWLTVNSQNTCTYNNLKKNMHNIFIVLSVFLLQFFAFI